MAFSIEMAQLNLLQLQGQLEDDSSFKILILIWVFVFSGDFFLFCLLGEFGHKKHVHVFEHAVNFSPTNVTAGL